MYREHWHTYILSLEIVRLRSATKYATRNRARTEESGGGRKWVGWLGGGGGGGYVETQEAPCNIVQSNQKLQVHCL